jgi:plasmid stabilization system protein ParE
MTIRLHEDAQQEHEDAADYYNQECPGLGYEFADEVYRTIGRIEDNPEAWQPLSKRTRRCLAHRFPYAVIYQLRSESILVIAIMHLHRDPNTWKGRISLD